MQKRQVRKMLLTDKYAHQINGVITCYDRIVIQGVIPEWSYADGMTGYLYGNNIRIFDYAEFSKPLTEQVRTIAEKIASDNNIDSTAKIQKKNLPEP